MRLEYNKEGTPLLLSKKYVHSKYCNIEASLEPSQAYRTGDILHRIEKPLGDTELADEIQQFSLQIRQNRLFFSPAGLVTLGWKFLRAVGVAISIVSEYFWRLSSPFVRSLFRQWRRTWWFLYRTVKYRHSNGVVIKHLEVSCNVHLCSASPFSCHQKASKVPVSDANATSKGLSRHQMQE